jgi:hypothetical protein
MQLPMPPPAVPQPEATMVVSVEHPQPMNTAPPAGPPAAKARKSGRCWKCAVNTHATKDCKVVHYCLVCDNAAHPTVRCPILKLPKPVGYLVGCGNDATLNLHLPESVHKPHLLPSGRRQRWCKFQGRWCHLQLFRVWWHVCALVMLIGSGKQLRMGRMPILSLFPLPMTWRGSTACRWGF